MVPFLRGGSPEEEQVGGGVPLGHVGLECPWDIERR